MTPSKTIVALVALALSVVACAAHTTTPAQPAPQAEAPAQGAVAMTPQSASQEIEATLTELFVAVDEHRWADAQAQMADSLVVDYAALGGHKGEIEAAALIEGWRGMLPRFDRTAHNAHGFSIHIAGERATATFDGIAVHLLDVGGEARIWTVFAGYEAELGQVDGTWRIERLSLDLYRITGDESVPGIAMAREPVPTATAERPAAVERFFAALEANDRAALAATFAGDVVQEMPLAPAGFPPRIEGRDALLGLYDNIIETPQRWAVEWLDTGRDDLALVRFSGEVDLPSGTYTNHYVSLFELDAAGQIVRIVEHFNPDVLLAGWPGLDRGHHSVHAAGASTQAVTAERVAFQSHGDTLVGTLFRPADAAPDAVLPAVIVAGSWTSVRQQMPDLYASRLAAEGIAALTFDFRGFGESEGAPRQLEDPARKIADLQAARAFLATRTDIATDQIAGLGVCAGAGYVAHAAAEDPGFAKVALVAPWLHDETIARSIYDMRPGGSDALLEASDAAAAAWSRSGEMAHVLATSELDPATAMWVPGDVFDYYLSPAKGAGPHYDNRFAVASWRPWITFDGIAAGERIGVPVQIVHSEMGAVPDGARRFAAHGGERVAITWLDGVGQEAFYHDAAAVASTLEVIAPFLGAPAN